MGEPKDTELARTTSMMWRISFLAIALLCASTAAMKTMNEELAKEMVMDYMLSTGTAVWSMDGGVITLSSGTPINVDDIDKTFKTSGWQNTLSHALFQVITRAHSWR